MLASKIASHSSFAVAREVFQPNDARRASSGGIYAADTRHRVPQLGRGDRAPANRARLRVHKTEGMNA